MKVVVAGSSGLIGSALTGHLRARGDEVVRLVRRAPGPSEARWDPTSRQIDSAILDGADAVVNLAGVGIGDKRWTPSRKNEILQSRVLATSALCSAIAELDLKPRVLVNASAVGYYGDGGDDILDETSLSGEGFLAEVCRQWEQATQPATDNGIRVANVRTAMVLASHGGALGRQLPIFKLGLGGRLGSGRQWVSWISLQDEIRAIEHVIETASIHGPVNLCSPKPVSNADFTRALASCLRRPDFFVVPRGALRLALGRELADELLFVSQRAVPTRLQTSGFSFSHPEISGALSAVIFE